MKLATTTEGRKVHMLFGTRLVCHFTGRCRPEIDQVIGSFEGEGREGTLATLHSLNIAPSRLCGHCFSAVVRRDYVAERRAAMAR